MFIYLFTSAPIAGRYCVVPYVVLLLHLVVDTPIDGIIVDSEEPI